jgi:hypothetical protein
MAKRPKPGDFVKVPLQEVRARLEGIDDVKRLPGAVLDGLAKAICVTRPCPPELGQLVTDAKVTIKKLDSWMEANEDYPDFNRFLKQAAEQLESYRRRVMVMMKMERPASYSATVLVDKDGLPHVSERSQSSEAEPERFFLGIAPSLQGNRKHLDAMLVLGMGVLIEFLEEDREQGFRWTIEESDRQEEKAARASKMMAKILDEFWAYDERIGQYIDGRVPENILRQHTRAAKKLKPFPGRHFLTYLAYLPATHAWLPRRKIKTDES